VKSAKDRISSLRIGDPSHAAAGRSALTRSKMRRFGPVAALFALATSVAPAIADDEPSSLQGYSGLLETPTAFTHAPGSAHFLFTNQVDPRYRGLQGMQTYAVSGGFFRYLEGSGRVTEVPSRINDLSLSFKLRLPIDILLPRLPIAVAIGAQDLGGTSPTSYFRTRYAVATARAWRLTGSVGYGSGPDRMHGVFGGASLRLASFAEVLADWDAREWNAGLRLSLPVRIFSVPLRFGAIAKASLSHGPIEPEWGATMTVPLGLDEDEQALASDAAAAEVRRERAAQKLEVIAQSPDPLAQLEADLVEIGFENVRAGRQDDTVVVEYENGVFGRAEEDGIGVVLGWLAWRAPEDAARFAVVLRRDRIALLELSGPLSSLRAYFEVPGPRGGPPLESALRLSWRPQERLSTSVANSSLLHSQLLFGPGLRTLIATEVGTFHYILSVRPEAIVTLWPGAVAYARADVPVLWSSAFADDGPLRDDRPAPQVNYALLYQALPIAPGLLVLAGAGLFRGDPGGVGEVLLTLGGGALAMGVQSAVTRDSAGSVAHALTGSARYDIVPLDSVVEVRAGEFFGGDQGFTASLGRWFGDTKLSVFASRTGNWLAGVEISLPLALRREMRPGLVQVRGTRRWTYEIHSVVGSQANAVQLSPPIAPVAPWNLETSFLDEGRLSLDRIVAGLPRARRTFDSTVSP
jgi:hypothetical protein